MRGFDIKSDWKPNGKGQIMLQVRVKRWYMPLLILKGLRSYRVPLRYFPLVFWRYYIKQGVKG
jgi:hypothetical protein